MNSKMLLLLLILLLFLSGCLQPEPDDEIKAVKSIQLPAGWQLSRVEYEPDYDEKIAARLEFSYPGMLCKVMAMGSVLDREENPGVSVDFYKKEFAEEVENKSMSSAAIVPTFKTENYLVVIWRHYTVCDEESGEKQLTQSICNSLVPFALPGELEAWEWYCG